MSSILTFMCIFKIILSVYFHSSEFTYSVVLVSDAQYGDSHCHASPGAHHDHVHFLFHKNPTPFEI